MLVHASAPVFRAALLFVRDHSRIGRTTSFFNELRSSTAISQQGAYVTLVTED